MTSRLASLLVQEGLVSAKKMAEAFQRQVIYGGTLDTILLEMDAVDEPALVEAMGRASGLPTAGDLPSREQLEAAGVRDWFPPHLSERFRAVPVSVDGNVVRVLVTDPPDRRQLDELGYMLSRSIDPIVVPEHRFVHAVELVYGTTVPARFSSLAAKVRQRAAEAPPRAPAPEPRVVQIEAEEPPEAPVEKLVVDTLRAEPPRAPTSVVVTDVPMPGARPRPVEAAAPKPAPVEERTAPLKTRQPDAPTALVPEVTVQHGEPAPRETPPEPLDLDEAARLLDAAEERDAIFEALCRGARSRLEFVALLMVHGDLAVGRMALPDASGCWLARDVISAFSVPLDKPSPFRAAAAGKAPYLGRLGEDALAGQALGLLGRRPPLPAVLLPIVLRERTVALLYGDAGGETIEAAVLADLSTTVAAAARAFQRIILRQKSGEFRPATSTPAGKVDGGSSGSAAPAGGEGTGWRAAAGGDVAGKARPTSRGFAALAAAVVGVPEASVHDAPTAAVPAGPPMTDPTALVMSVVREDAHARSSAEALVVLGERAAEAVVAQLPGPLRLDRHTLRGPAPRVAEHGPLLSVLSRLGATATRALVARANDPSLEVRYYVTLALGELDVPEVVPALGQRLFDPDAGVRHAAITGLQHASPSPELRTLTESLRGELPGPEAMRQRHAAEALGALRDAPSVPRLIELVKHHEPAVVTAARRALIEITKQDFGTSRWRWRSWWDRHRNDSRVEWMLEGLGHAEPEVRMSASDELRGLSKDHFGYHFDGPKREREEARKRWVEWWRQHGSKEQRS